MMQDFKASSKSTTIQMLTYWDNASRPNVYCVIAMPAINKELSLWTLYWVFLADSPQSFRKEDHDYNIIRQNDPL